MKCLKCDGEGELCLFDHKELDHDITCPRCEGKGDVEFYNEQEVNKDKVALVEMLADINRRIKCGSFNIPMYESYYMKDVEALLEKHKEKK